MQVRISNPLATPYLRDKCSLIQELTEEIPAHRQLCVDLGCGNGRNSNHIEQVIPSFRRCSTYLYDLHPIEGSDTQALDLNSISGKPEKDLSLSRESASLILCQYVLMFLSGVGKLENVSDLITSVSRDKACLVCELFQNKREGVIYKGVQLQFITLLEQRGWRIEHERKDHFIMALS